PSPPRARRPHGSSAGPRGTRLAVPAPAASRGIDGGCVSLPAPSTHEPNRCSRYLSRPIPGAPDAMATHRIRTGCAGWSIGTPQRGLFDDGPSMLARYATRFDIAEVNSSFYRPHRRETWRRWADSVPAGFRFSAKMPRAISHELRLRGAGPALDRFLSEVEGLGGKLGGLLLQLPPSLVFDARSASAFFRMLRRRTGLPVACEPRHASWFDAPADALLLQQAILRVAADPARLPAAAFPGGATADWTYRRWHGSPRMYYSRYDD